MIEGGIELPDKNDNPDWWAEQYQRFPAEYAQAIFIYCAHCGDCSQLEDADNLGEGQYCTCTCHETGVALAKNRKDLPIPQKGGIVKTLSVHHHPSC